jgi:uncharacterized membrane protein
MSFQKNQPTQKTVQITKQEFRSGPLPAPEELERYENIAPGFAERLLVMAEKEQDKRLDRENQIINLSVRSINNTRIGLFFGFFSVIIMVSLCGFFAYLGDIKSGAWTAGAVIIGLAGVFVLGRKIQNNQENK